MIMVFLTKVGVLDHESTCLPKVGGGNRSPCGKTLPLPRVKGFVLRAHGLVVHDDALCLCQAIGRSGLRMHNKFKKKSM